eukprot:GGOE01041548.1.p1 GENE.GGOE01041548.1~~GGOE01041548.1.p1  ORF type:complete len:140 (+),score=25.76 GGOE01041548.1:416-835(+)
MAALGMGLMGSLPGAPMGNAASIGAFPVPGAAPNAFGLTGLPIVVPKRHDLQPEEGTNLHVFGLDNLVTDLHLYQAFAPYGAIRSVRVIVDKVTGNPKGYGFVQFYYKRDAQNAMGALHGAQVGYRAWQVTVHQGKAPA